MMKSVLSVALASTMILAGVAYGNQAENRPADKKACCKTEGKAADKSCGENKSCEAKGEQKSDKKACCTKK